MTNNAAPTATVSCGSLLVPLLFITGLVFLVLKIAGVIAWAWWIVFLPFIALVVFWLITFVAAFALAWLFASKL